MPKSYAQKEVELTDNLGKVYKRKEDGGIYLTTEYKGRCLVAWGRSLTKAYTILLDKLAWVRGYERGYRDGIRDAQSRVDFPDTTGR